MQQIRFENKAFWSDHKSGLITVVSFDLQDILCTNSSIQVFNTSIPECQSIGSCSEILELKHTGRHDSFPTRLMERSAHIRIRLSKVSLQSTSWLTNTCSNTG